jgi:hypothetical protein
MSFFTVAEACFLFTLIFCCLHHTQLNLGITIVNTTNINKFGIQHYSLLVMDTADGADVWGGLEKAS